MTTPLEQQLEASVEALRAKAIIATRCPTRSTDVTLWETRELDAVHAQLEAEFRRGMAANDTE